jgi:hypothetical protein
MSSTREIIDQSSKIIKYLIEKVRDVEDQFSLPLLELIQEGQVYETKPFSDTHSVSDVLQIINDLYGDINMLSRVNRNLKSIAAQKGKVKRLLMQITDIFDFIYKLIPTLELTIRELEEEKMFKEEVMQWTDDHKLPISGIKPNHKLILARINPLLYTKYSLDINFDDYVDDRVESLDCRYIDCIGTDHYLYLPLYWYTITTAYEISQDDKSTISKLLTKDKYCMALDELINNLSVIHYDNLWKPLHIVDKIICDELLKTMYGLINHELKIYTITHFQEGGEDNRYIISKA